MTLRENLIEVGADIWQTWAEVQFEAVAAGNPPPPDEGYPKITGFILDAFLDCLAENADETVHTKYDDVAAAWRLGDIAVEDLLAVLRESDV